MKIYLQNTFGKIAGAEDETFDVLRRLMSYEIKGAVFARRSRPFWDAREYLMNKKGEFPFGLVHMVKRYLDKENIAYDIVDQRIPPTGKAGIKITIPEGMRPRPYQVEAAKISSVQNRGVYIIGTGGGKTFTSALVIAHKDVPTLFITPNVGLRSQVTESFDTFFPGQVSNNVTDDKPIIVTNIQALAKPNPADFERFQLLFTDEFHHSAAKTYLDLNRACYNAYHRYGMTGTFVRPDGENMTLHGVISEVIYRVTTSQLIEQGYLVRPQITLFHHRLKGWSKYRYATAYDEIIRYEPTNKKIAAVAQAKIAEGKQVLILVRRVEHGKILNHMIPEAVYLHGELPVSYREDQKKRFINREFPCLIATEIFGEGTDIPSVDVLINGRFQATEIQTKQGIGRVLRKAEGKEYAEVFDFIVVGQSNLKNHSVERATSYRSEPAFRIRAERM